MKYIEIKVKELVPDPESEGCFRLVFEDVEGGLELPMIVSALDARPILSEMGGERNIRPLTHDIFSAFIEAAGYKLTRLNVREFRRGVFYADLVFRHEDGEESLEMDCRPSDGVALALQAGAPMYAAEEVMNRVGILLGNDMGKMKAAQRLQVMEQKLTRLVDEERYEEAGILRDRIRSLKAEVASGKPE